MNPDAVRTVVRVRTLGPSGLNPPQTEVIDRLQALTEDGPIAELDVNVWGASMGMTQDGWDPVDTREQMAEFEQWATEQGYTLRPAFDWRAGESEGDGEAQRREIVTPLITLAIYSDDEETLQAVYPHVDGEEVRTIHDGVETLESLAGETEQSANKRREHVAVPTE
jgi:hypothetical protein